MSTAWPDFIHPIASWDASQKGEAEKYVTQNHRKMPVIPGGS